MRASAGQVGYRLALFALPFALAFVYVVTLLALLPIDAWFVVMGGAATYLFAPLGTEVVVPIVFLGLFAVDATPPAFVLGVATVVLVDVFTALFFLWNWDLVERAPYLGRAVRRVEEKCREIVEKRRWGERATYAALATYVALPFQMTGGLFGSILGRVMGLDRTKVFLAVSAGSLVGAVPIGVAAYVVGQVVLERFVADLSTPAAQALGLAAGILITAAFIALIVVLYRRGTRNADRG